MLGAQPTVLRYRVAAILAALLLDPVFRALCRTREGGRKGGRGSGEREDEIVYFDWRCSKKLKIILFLYQWFANTHARATCKNVGPDGVQLDS